MIFQLVPKSVTLNDLERRNGPYLRYFTEFMYDVVVKKFTFAIASPDEFLVTKAYTVRWQNVCKRLMSISQSTVARWLYCMERPEYNIRLEALGYLCDCLSGGVQR